MSRDPSEIEIIVLHY